MQPSPQLKGSVNVTVWFGGQFKPVVNIILCSCSKISRVPVGVQPSSTGTSLQLRKSRVVIVDKQQVNPLSLEEDVDEREEEEDDEDEEDELQLEEHL
jgi:hypothetical protein